MRRDGFTLLETLVALAITALVLAGLQGAVLRTAAARGTMAAAADRVATARTLLLGLAAEIEAARPGAAAAFVVRAPDDAGPPWSALRLTSAVREAGPDPLPASDVHALAYEVRADPDHPARGVLERRRASRPGAPDPPAALVDGVRRFTVRSFDGTLWRRDWPPGPLPVAVEVALELDDGTALGTTVAPALGGQ